ncbi:hypothetical protein SY83_04780 [Paenibacillus swuensis]|uniref:AraC family transcriptional regulator n=1 Tax=Paenibacillus swuensis TaxID=1178515 RepID=A0A172TFS5_9BACL|nr:response regulator [Paenibacillus swuensis]ANE45727.1 hypothetical protein SY83_04780 [Paenibacillus swuensis]
MYTILIVEDEPHIRKGIISMVDWSSLQVTVIGEAGNGADALALMEQQAPDLLLTDIEMPRMNGLELIRTTQERGWNITPLILSGHDQFHYTKQALKLGISDYILKPCRPGEIQEVISNAILNRQQRSNEQENISLLKKNWVQGLPYMKNQVLSRWFQHASNPVEDRPRQAAQLEMKLRSEKLTLFLLRFDSSSFANPNYSESDAELIRFAACNILQEVVPAEFMPYCEIVRVGDDIAIVGNVESVSGNVLSMAFLQEKLESLQKLLQSYLKVSLSIGISASVHPLDTLHIAFQEACEALRQKFFRGSGGIYFWEQHKDTPVQVAPNRKTELALHENKLLEQLRAGKFSEAIDEMDEWLALLQQLEDTSAVQLHTMSLLTKMSDIVDQPEHQAEWGNTSAALISRYSALESFDDVAKLISEMIRQLVDMLHMGKPLHKSVVLAKQYMEANYRHNLTVESVSKEIFVSPNYLSTLFKQEMGIRFLDYLHQYRIQQAKALLLDTDMKIYHVAKSCGYNDEKHFTKMFKKWTGVNPSEFK